MKILEDGMNWKKSFDLIQWSLTEILTESIRLRSSKSSFADYISSNLRISRISIFEWRLFQMTFIRLISSRYSLWELVDYVLTDSKDVHETRSSSSSSSDLLSHDIVVSDSNRLLKWHLSPTESKKNCVWSDNEYKMYLNHCLQDLKYLKEINDLFKKKMVHMIFKNFEKYMLIFQCLLLETRTRSHYNVMIRDSSDLAKLSKYFITNIWWEKKNPFSWYQWFWKKKHI